MDIHQLKTFLAVAREGSITRASELLHLSQPAASAHIKAIEDALGLALFDRTSRGMVLTREGERLRAKVEQTLSAHQELMDEATRIKGHLTGKLHLGASSNSNNEAIGRLLTTIAERYPDVEVVFKHGTSADIVTGIRNGTLDAGFYNDAGEPDRDLATTEVSRFGIVVAAAPGLVSVASPPDWKAVAELPWIYPTASSCCGRFAESLFRANHIRPQRVISVDREEITRTLIAGGVGIGLLHAESAAKARDRGEAELLFESDASVRVLFTHLASRIDDPMVSAAAAILRDASTTSK